MESQTLIPVISTESYIPEKEKKLYQCRRQTRDVHGGAAAVVVTMAARLRQVFLEDMVKMHESEHKFNVRKYNIQRLDESYRLVTTVLGKNNHSRKTQNIFLATIAAVANIHTRWSSLCRTHIQKTLFHRNISHTLLNICQNTRHRTFRYR